ncbi:hypothetical protein J4460_00650 [Candidatus Woesearchaeota archaeon]|nr:MAG: hypothetical protein QS99_C0002G0056 [archaeon GW2011_AR4]MBS3129160.1 hypothetical protein [Candidatus Woesearchaeota archaeon]HIH37893.1 hypothetical protein [Candidatus Woesearchaeota archaeon]HIJ04020.1 hypothetical protein [Candidatus Woesearchaeota archaeon]
MRGRSKRGQGAGAGQAATFIALIAFFIVLYILFLPPADREALLNDDTSSTCTGTFCTHEGEILLEETPGKLDTLGFSSFEHHIASFTIFQKEDATEFLKLQTISVKSDWFKKNSANATFSIQDPTKVSSALLAFSTPIRKGLLTIQLNRKTIFSGDIHTENIDPIMLPPALLNQENVLTFTVDNPGFAFWTSNAYRLENLQVIGTVVDNTRQSATQSFFITQKEKENLERVNLKLFPDCNPSASGILTLHINDRAIFSGIPDCGILNRYEFDPATLTPGENTFSVKADTGSYLLDQIVIVTELTAPDYPTYYFLVDPEAYDAIRAFGVDANLDIEFVEQEDLNSIVLNLNGVKKQVRTRDMFASLLVNDFILKGNNYLQIVPQSDVNIAKVRLTLS